MRRDSGWRVGAAGCALQFLLCAQGVAQVAPPSPAEGPQAEQVLPSPAPVDRTPRRVVVPGRPSGSRDSVGAGRLKGWRALALAEGEGRVLVDGVPRSVKAGDVIGGYVVKAVGPGRVVLEDASALAILTFDAGGAARVRLVHTADPTRQKTMGLPPQ